MVAVPGQSFVDGVVDHFVHQVVQAALTGGTDVHTRPLADCFQALKYGDVAGVVVARSPWGHTGLGLCRLVSHVPLALLSSSVHVFGTDPSGAGALRAGPGWRWGYCTTPRTVSQFYLEIAKF